MENDFCSSRENPPPPSNITPNFSLIPSPLLRHCPTPSCRPAALPYPSSSLAFNVVVVVVPLPSPTITFLCFHKSIKKNLISLCIFWQG